MCDDSERSTLIEDHLYLVDGLASKFRLKNSLLEEKDLAQEAYVALVKAARSYDATRGVRFAAYARTCMTNALINYARVQSGKASQTDSLNEITHHDGEVEFIDLLIADGVDAHRESHRNEVRAALRDGIDSLTVEQRGIIELWLDGARWTEIASDLGISKQAAQQMARRGFSHIKAHLEKCHLIEQMEELEGMEHRSKSQTLVSPNTERERSQSIHFMPAERPASTPFHEKVSPSQSLRSDRDQQLSWWQKLKNFFSTR